MFSLPVDRGENKDHGNINQEPSIKLCTHDVLGIKFDPVFVLFVLTN